MLAGRERYVAGGAPRTAPDFGRHRSLPSLRLARPHAARLPPCGGCTTLSGETKTPPRRYPSPWFTVTIGDQKRNRACLEGRCTGVCAGDTIKSCILANRARSQDEARQVGVLGQIADVRLHEGGVDLHSLARPVGRGEGNIIEHALHHGLQTPRAD